MNKFTVETQTRQSHLNVKISGAMDESSDYSSISFAGVTTATFNFVDLQLINSIGITKWISFMMSLPAELEIVFEQCPSVFVEQMATVTNFTGNKKPVVASFEMPYFCEACEQDTSFYMAPSDIVKDPSGALKAPPKLCPACNEPLEFDRVPSKYFQFLRAK